MSQDGAGQAGDRGEVGRATVRAQDTESRVETRALHAEMGYDLVDTGCEQADSQFQAALPRCS